MKHIRIFVIALIAVLTAANAYSVTDQEMDEAKAKAAKYYLRWSNNMSGYLDGQDVKSMSELTSLLREKEKENLKAFNSVKTPSDYAGWDKEKLVEYWTKTFFESPGLNSDGKRAGAINKIRADLKKMKVSSPQTAPQPQAQPEATPAPEGVQDQTPAADEIPAEPSNEAAVEPVTDQSLADAEIPLDEELADEEAEEQGGSSTWIYVIVLIVLVVIVVWLVVYASNLMKRQSPSSRYDKPASRYEKKDYVKRENTSANESRNAEPRTQPRTEPKTETRPLTRTEPRTEPRVMERTTRSSAREDAALREQTRMAIAKKDEEVKILRERLQREESRSAELGMEIERMKLEQSRLLQQIQQLREQNNSMNAEKTHTMRRAINDPEPKPAQPIQEGIFAVEPKPVEKPEPKPKEAEPEKKEILKVIYLGRTNKRGIFVRADRRINPGNTIYRLDTNDGLVGTFHVVDQPEVVETALSNPTEYLGGGCMGEDIMDTTGVTHILTVSAGTAIFENGYWKVLRKTQIRYE